MEYKMAVVKVGKLDLAWYMSDWNPKSKTNKVSSISLRVTSAAVTAYNGAADDAARAATTIGVLITAYLNLTKGVLKSVSAGFEYDQNLAPPANTVGAYEFDKFLVSARDTSTNVATKSSIPARDLTNVTLGDDAVTVVLADGADVADFVSAYNAIVLSEDENAVAIQRMIVSQ